MAFPKKIAVALAVLSVTAIGAGSAYYLKTRPMAAPKEADVKEPGEGTGVKGGPLLKIGSISYAWGGGLTTVCRDGRVYTSPLSSPDSQPTSVSLLAVADNESMTQLAGSLGGDSFDYKEDFDIPNAFDAAGTRFAEYSAGTRKVDIDATRFEQYQEQVGRMIEKFPVRSDKATISLRNNGFFRVYEWPFQSIDPKPYKEKLLKDIEQWKKWEPQNYEVDTAGVDAVQLESDKKKLSETPQDYRRFSLADDPYTLYWLNYYPDYVGGPRFMIHVDTFNYPLSLLASALGKSETETADLLGGWEIFTSKDFILNDGGLLLEKVSEKRAASDFAVTWTDAKGEKHVFNVHYDKKETPTSPLTPGQDPCSLPMPTDARVKK